MIETVPVVELTTDDGQDFVRERETYRALHHDLFRRREQREQYAQYVRGLLVDLSNKSVETMVLHIKGDSSRSLNRSLVVVLQR